MYIFNKAFSLLELVIVLIIVAILLAIALPYWQQLVKKNLAKNDINTLRNTINFARQEAIIKAQKIFIKPQSNSWYKYQVVDDQNNIFKMVQLSKNATLTSNVFNNNYYIIFEPNGYTNYQNGTFKYYQNNVLQYTLTINKAGQTRVNNA